MQLSNVCVAIAVLFVAHLVTFSGLLCQGQRASPRCIDAAVNDTDCCTCGTTAGGIYVTLCSGQCPSGYYQDHGIHNKDPDCLHATTTPALETTATPTTTQTLLTVPTLASTEAATDQSDEANNSNIWVNSRNITCRPCHPDCASCNGSGSANCTICRDGFEKNITTNECQKKVTALSADDNNEVAIIAGATAAGGVVLVVVVVVVCCVCRRRRQRGMEDIRINSAPGIGLDQTPVPEVRREEKESGESIRRGEVDLAYENIPRAPRPLSIQRGHDQVTRYVRDPTIKRTDATEAVLPRSPTEAKELEALPVAPTLPPGQRKKSLQPPAEQYEVVEAGQENQAFHFQQNVHPQRAATSKPKGQKHHGGGKGGRRKTGPGDLPNPTAPFSMPNLPSQVSSKVERPKAAAEAPDEDYMNTGELVVPKVKTGGDESEEEDYENAPAIKSEKSVFCAPAADDNDLEDYENTGTKGSLLPHKHADKHQLHGEMNLGAILDESQEVYGNQDAIEETDRHHHGHLHGSEDDDQPLYTNDDTENPYQNIHFGPKT